MRLRRKFPVLTRLSLLALASSASLFLSGAERIRFSRPAVPLAQPGQEFTSLPEPKEPNMDFGSSVPPSALDSASQMRARRIPLPIRRPEPEDLSPLALRDPNRKFEQAMQDKDRMNGRDPLDLRDPSKMRDATQPGPEKEAAPAAWSLDPSNIRRKNEGRSLLPTPEFGRDELESGRRSAESGRTGRNATDREKQRERNPFDVVEKIGNDAYRSGSPFEIYSPQSREKPTAQQMERRAAFEKLLNPSAESTVKGPGSLDPVTANAAPAQPVAGLHLPVLGRGTSLPGQSPTDPTVTFNRQQERWSGPVFESEHKRYMPPAAAAPSPTAAPFQTPLNRQPTVREFPVRRF